MKRIAEARRPNSAVGGSLFASQTVLPKIYMLHSVAESKGKIIPSHWGGSVRVRYRVWYSVREF